MLNIIESELSNGLTLRKKQQGGAIDGYCLKLDSLSDEVRRAISAPPFWWWSPASDGKIWLCFSDQSEALRHFSLALL